ncbi:MAG: DUF2478 domain-containing protein [Steroidobacteraceae bacterium]
MKRIGVVRGRPSAEIQRLFRELATRWRQTARIVGVIEESGGPDGAACNAGQLISLADGASFSIFQDLGRGSTACNVHPDGALSAGEAVRRNIEAGCDLVVLSKFGKLEAEQRGGLMPAFIAAAESNVPILTSVSAKFDVAWRQFAEDAYCSLSADYDVIEEWCRTVCDRG